MTSRASPKDTPPPCRALGSQCRSLPVVLRVTTLDQGPDSGDHEATWLLGHTERITFLTDLWEDDEDLYVAARLQIPCRFHSEAGGRRRCTAHGYTGKALRQTPTAPAPRRVGPETFRIVERGRLASRRLPLPSPPPRSLPVKESPNPCATAPCRTADHTRGAACCRDLQLEIMCTTRERRLEALIRNRRRPYLCKVDREGEFSLSAEVISACGFLAEDGVRCSLHGRVRPDGRPAKPELCSEWPDGAEVYHPGCALIPLSPP